MKAAFIGGGSLRLLPIFRGIFHECPEIFRNGEIRLIDLKLERAEAVAKLIKACPEYQNVQCKVVATTNMDEGLTGIDVLYLTMAARREPTETLAKFLAYEYGYFSSDQLTVNGAFLSLRLGGLILDIAKKLEKLSPKALMLIFPNPVAVYSCMVNRFTKIKALGICGGFGNHRWDLGRLCFGKDGFDPNWNVVAAGVNHLSFILRGEYKGEDLYNSLLPRTLTDSWKLMEFSHTGIAKEMMEMAICDLYNMYRKYNTLVFSTEYDGLAHISIGNSEKILKKYDGSPDAFDVKNARVNELARIEKRFAEFIDLSKNPEKIQWDLPRRENPYCGKDITDISIPILKAVAGIEKMRIVASRPNYGVVDGLPEGAAAEYTMDIFKDTVTPVENQYIPSPFRGLIASLSEFQTLNAEALATRDPRIFAAALDAYPVHRFEAKRKEFFQKMFDLYTDVDPLWSKAMDYLY
ncbi:MAG: hypothetical protein E7040_07320 [Lentisphaerae bacterium]|nr:hypothetical protein [Lentisphaerota bacterium]